MSARWFLDNGIDVFPIKHRDKVPACASWDDYHATIAEAETWTNYGVNLGSGFLGVVDSDAPEIETWVAANVPPTPFVVKTARGLHRYYRLTGAAPHFIHRAGHTIEFRNQGQYVVGPGSIHASGVPYVALAWSWRIQDVPFFPVDTFAWEDRPDGERGSADGQPFVLPTIIKAGERHDLLFKLMRSLQARGMEDVEQLLATLHAANKAHCSPPIDDHELTKYIRRASRYKDRPDFTRLDEIEAEELAGALLEQGADASVAIAAAKAVDPEFDPSGRAPLPSEEKLKKQVAKMEAKLEKMKAELGSEASEIVSLVDESSEIIDEDELLDDIEEVE